MAHLPHFKSFCLFLKVAKKGLKLWWPCSGEIIVIIFGYQRCIAFMYKSSLYLKWLHKPFLSMGSQIKNVDFRLFRTRSKLKSQFLKHDYKTWETCARRIFSQRLKSYNNYYYFLPPKTVLIACILHRTHDETMQKESYGQ